MRRIATSGVVLVCDAALLCALGCQSVGLHFLSVIGFKQKPLSVALVADEPPDAAAQALNPFPTYAALQNALADHLGRPVAVDVCFPFQVDLCLSSGWYDLALVTPAQYARLKQPDALRVLAVPVDGQGRAARSALVVVPAGSELQSPAELRGKVVAFGPAGDSRTHHAALQLLESAGLKKTDLSLEVLPVPGSLKHLPDMRSVAQTVINGSSDAGFLDEAAWEGFPEHAETEGAPARDRLRVIGRTIALPSRLLIASPGLDEATASRLRAFLLAVGRDHPQVLEPLAASGYQVPDDRLLAACRGLAGTVEAAAPPEATRPQQAADAETPPDEPGGTR